MPSAGWWEALWPDPAGVLASIGLKPGMEVIDLCSGDGWFTLQIAKVARHVAAIDIDPTLLEVARVRLIEAGVTNCSFIAGDAYDITRLWPEPVDLVFMANACRTQRGWRRRSKLHSSRADVLRSSIGTPARARERQSWVSRAARRQNCD